MSLTFPTLRFSGQRTRLSGKKKKHRSWLTLYCSPLLFAYSFPPTCVSLAGRSGMRATSTRDFLRALTIIAWNVVIVCRRSKRRRCPSTWRFTWTPEAGRTWDRSEVELDTSVIDVSILEDVTLRWGRVYLRWYRGRGCFFFFFF